MVDEDRPPRAVVDTNLFVSGSILKRGNPYELLEAWRHKGFVLLISDALQTEIAEVLIRPEIKQKYHLTTDEVEDPLRLLQTEALQLEFRLKIVRRIFCFYDRILSEGRGAGVSIFRLARCRLC